jgi:uncharacterized membrane protein YphA (DoxX/SURF4 family)
MDNPTMTENLQPDRRHRTVRLPLVLYTTGRLFLAAVFLYACWEKIADPAGFAEAIRNYQLLPEALVTPAALLLPWVELVCGICLLVNRWTRGAALLITILMLIFTIALGINMARGMDISCGCFTLDQHAPAGMWRYMVRDCLLLGISAGILFFRPPQGGGGRSASTP